ncbi:putative short-chain dehydrogenase/reductase family protein [Hypoxylon fuscum]|nr:putative short-chain dehydrogenase/reductase family protein [Hypoxylon fuscum]
MGWYYSQLFVTPPYPTKSFEGQTVLVTGSNVGLGFEAARHFARLKASKVILAVRNVKAGEAAKNAIETSTKRPGCCEVWHLDLASFASVKAFGERAATLPRLDVVVENAAVANPETFATAEGHERHITVNVISTTLLALLLLPKLQATSKSFPGSSPRLTCVTSELHAYTTFPERHKDDIFAALDDEKATNMAERYPTSKLLEVLLMRQLAGRVAGTGVIINMVNPGLCHSRLARDYGWGFWFFKLLFARRTEVGSRMLLVGASADASSHGTYMMDGVVAENGLSAFVTSDEGAAAQGKVWNQLGKLLENISPECLAVVS